MSTQLKLRRGTTAQHSTFTGAEGEVTVDTTKDTVVVHDGTTAGGFPLARESALASKQDADAELTTLAGMSSSRASFLASTQPFAFRNRIINGDMRIDQRNNGAAISATSDNFFPVDRWRTTIGNFAPAVVSLQRVADAPAGFTFSTRLTVTTTNNSLSASGGIAMTQLIEGFNIADLGWGTANAAPVTLSFWVKASTTGVYSAGLISGNETRSYVAPFVINAANVWEFKTITAPGDVGGSWFNDNNGALRVAFTVAAGASRRTTSTNQWIAGGIYSSADNVALNTINGATFAFTGVQLEAGTVATPFERVDYGTSLMRCQRYYQAASIQMSSSSDTWYSLWYYKVSMRATPTLAGGGAGFVTSLNTPENFIGYQTNRTTGQALTASAEL